MPRTCTQPSGPVATRCSPSMAPCSIAPSGPQAKAKLLAAERRARRLAQHEQVWALYRQGWSGEKIAPHLGVSRSTVYRYLRSEVFPERKGRSDADRSRLDAWRDVVLEHWNGDRRNSRKMVQDLQQRGCRGSYPTLARYLRRLRAVDTVGASSGLPASARPRLDAAPRQVLTPTPFKVLLPVRWRARVRWKRGRAR